jgi:hypothetical protein
MSWNIWTFIDWIYSSIVERKKLLILKIVMLNTLLTLIFFKVKQANILNTYKGKVHYNEVGIITKNKKALDE